jgi:hypothetical protein
MSKAFLLDKEESQKILTILDRKALKVLDLFCVIRYYKNAKPKKTR